ncbi:hypothetical protein EVAR_45573_1 [Eumeta japonica]|uniref:Uncharacterized protein n=1 Tax=Eumeta variegata TaxID=151549 RepID=A0A4C1YV43_EUMVA|nr:hypothetical protein EVAR_45573_1 [Eumeta japonica]
MYLTYYWSIISLINALELRSAHSMCRVFLENKYRNSDVRKRYGLKEDIVTKVKMVCHLCYIRSTGRFIWTRPAFASKSKTQTKHNISRTRSDKHPLVMKHNEMSATSRTPAAISGRIEVGVAGRGSICGHPGPAGVGPDYSIGFVVALALD